MKGDIYDGGHRIPHIVKWPRKIKPGTTNNSLNTLASFYSTVADLLKLEVSSSDSYSIFSELINDVKIEEDRSIIHHSSEGHFSIRNGNWKMIEKLGSGGFSLPRRVEPTPGVMQERLYNMKNDLSEKIDLASKYPKIISKMKNKLDSIRAISLP